MWCQRTNTTIFCGAFFLDFAFACFTMAFVSIVVFNERFGMILKQKEAVARYRRSRVTLLRYEKELGMPVMRQGNSDPLYDTDDIDAWFKSAAPKEEEETSATEG